MNVKDYKYKSFSSQFKSEQTCMTYLAKTHLPVSITAHILQSLQCG